MSSEETIKEVPHDWLPLTRVMTNVPQEKKNYLEEPESSPIGSSPTTSELKYGQIIEELEDTPIILTWRSWVVVAVASFALISQVFVVVAAGQVLAFISSDLGDDDISGWVIQGPLLIQCVLSPILGRLSDVLERKYLAAIPPLIAFTGAVTSARANSMSMLIGGGILNGAALATMAINQAIPSEVLPRKYRPLAHGITYFLGSVGSLIGGLVAGAVANRGPHGWRNIFWIEASLHLVSSIGLLLLYNPPARPNQQKFHLKRVLWECDPIGSGLFVLGMTSLLIALNWGDGQYAWADPEVSTCLAVGILLLAIFAFYEWRGRQDGIVAHIFFKRSPNFALATLIMAVDGWLFFGVVNTFIPQVTLHLGFARSSWIISLRQLSFALTAVMASTLISLYSTISKDLKWPLTATFLLFLIGTIGYTFISPNMDHIQIGLNILMGVGLSAAVTLSVVTIQFAAPHSHLSTATGLALSARAIGGVIGSAVENTITEGALYPRWTEQVETAVVATGLPRSAVSSFIQAFRQFEGKYDDSKSRNNYNETLTSLLMNAAAISGPNSSSPSINAITAAAERASQNAYAHAYHWTFLTLIPWMVIVIVITLFLRPVRHLMTERIDATVEMVGKKSRSHPATRELEVDPIVERSEVLDCERCPTGQV